MMPNKGFVLWFTGLSGSGKTTLADALYQRLLGEGISKIERLDGDLVREHLTKDLGFSKEDRFENIKRVSYIAKLLSKHGVGVLATFVSPYKEMRKHVETNVNNFIEVFVYAPLEVCEKRDVKGLYKKARNGEIKNFTGISDPFEHPEDPHIKIHTHEENLEDSVEKVYKYLVQNNYLN